SLPDNAYFVSSLNKLAMFQSYAEVSGISPSEGSMEGGTILTINGQYFDQTDSPAKVLVGGGRGLKLETWNNSSPKQLDEILAYTESNPGYNVTWVDSASYTWPVEWDHFVARFSGFMIPTETDKYQFYIKGDDCYALYFSNTGHPKDKVISNSSLQ
ncbi:UNVERIFIED_CONTAM: hypothetical protein FKN15_008441, partial [Acipenser sinensis]